MTDSDVLISRKEAAAILKTSEKKLQRLTSAKKLTVIYQKRAAGGQEAFYRSAEVNRVKEALEKGESPPTIQNAIVTVSKKTALAQQAANETNRKATISASEAAAKLILTLAETSVLTHISENDLRADLRIGKLRGIIKGRGWKIKRNDLEEYIRTLW